MRADILLETNPKANGKDVAAQTTSRADVNWCMEVSP